MSLLDRIRGRAAAEGGGPQRDGGPQRSDRWLVVGLGNPEDEYGGTRHNVGADTVRRLADRLGASFKAHKAGAAVADSWSAPGGTPLSLAVPFGYMNNSGGPVSRAARFYKVTPDRLVVVHDDLDLDVGKLRLKQGGGVAGHRGLADIRRQLGSDAFYRVRIGIGRPPGRQDPADYVLKRFPRAQREEIDVVCERAVDAILDLVADGLEPAQNRHHPV